MSHHGSELIGDQEDPTFQDPGNPGDRELHTPTEKRQVLEDPDATADEDQIQDLRGDRRLRKLTERGQALYDTERHKYTRELIDLRRLIQQILTDYATTPQDKADYLARKYELTNLYVQFKELTNKYFEFLTRTNTEDSLAEKKSEEIIYRTVTDNVIAVLDEMKLLTDRTDRSERASVVSRHSSKRSKKSFRSRKSEASNISTELARQKAKAEAAKAVLEFEKRQIEIKKEKARLEEEEMQSKARAERKKTELDADMTFLERERDAAVAKAEYEAYRNELKGDSEDSEDLTDHDVGAHHTAKSGHEKVNISEELKDFDISVHNKAKSSEHDKKIDTLRYTELNPNVPPFVPKDQASGIVDVTKFLLKRDLLLQRFTNFDDRPENFWVWKNSFSTVVKELDVTPVEELDLLCKWLGPQSRQYALSLRSANAGNPEKGLQRLWGRLDQRFGSPEMIESALKKKLENFPKLGVKDNKRLFDLADILSEIESCMENPKYSMLLSYYNTSSGVLPVVCKLPFHLQGKWRTRASRYKTQNDVVFPPFTEFCAFIKEMSTMLNDPGFDYAIDHKEKPDPRQGRDKYSRPNTSRQTPVHVRKTEVKEEPEENDRVKERCLIHDTSKHSLNQCRVFRNKTVAERKRLLKEHHICYRCCQTNRHIFKDCTTLVKCDVCASSRHPTALHSEGAQPESRPTLMKNHGRERIRELNSNDIGNQTKETVATKCTNVCGPEFAGRSCAKIVPVIVYPGAEKEKGKRIYAILDDQSNRTLGRPELFDMLGVSLETSTQYTLTSCAGTHQAFGRHAEGLTVSAMDQSFALTLPDVIECCEIPNTRSEIPTPEVVQYQSHLQDIPIPSLDPEADILLLIGRDVPEAHHVLEQRVGPRNSPFAQRLGFGWVVIGDVCIGQAHKPDTVNVMKTRVLEDGRPTIFPQCDYKFVIKHCRDGSPHIDTDIFCRTKNDNRPGLSIEDKRFLKIMDEEFKKDENGHWSAPLPFRDSRPRLPNNKSQAIRRANILDMGLKKNEEKKRHFTEFMEKIFMNGHAEVAPPLKDDEECWYLPVFGVYHPKKKDQIRVVFDSSAKFEGVSLNSVLLSGPDLTNSLVGVLMRFRENPIAVTGDIQQMFYQFHVHEKDRNYLRFLWYRDNDMSKDLIEYRMRVHVFGNSPSPAVATYGLRRIAEQAAGSYGEDVKSFIQNDFYVDDGLASLTTADEAVSLMKRTKEALFTKGRLNLQKITSNDKTVLCAFSEEDLDKGLKTIDLDQDLLPVQRSLGLSWDLEEDCFIFKVAEKRQAYTKRGALSTVNSLYDPLGFLGPVTIGGKLLLRDITTLVEGWDEPLPEDISVRWQTWLQSLQALTTIKVPRAYISSNAKPTKKELHVFSDASEKAIAAVAFLKITDENGQVYISFVHGKSKVAPRHGHTIPRLELCAAVLAVEIAGIVSEELSLPSDRIKYYTDSKVVLGYLQNKTRRFYIYVENRVSRILQFSDSRQWSYIATDKNPADQGTRYVPPLNLQESSWLTGEVLREISCEIGETNKEFPLVKPEEDHEIRPHVQSCKTVIQDELKPLLERFAKFSDWERLAKAVSLLTHFASSFKAKKGDNNPCQGWHKCKSYKNVESNKQAKDFIIKEYQKVEYGKEIKCLTEGKPLPRDSNVLALSPFLDEAGILRVGGRIRKAELPPNEKHPILIPGKSHLATLLIRHCHESVLHQGRHFTEGAVRAAGYWITGAKRLINLLIFRCVKCRRLRGKLEHQKMSDLPADRLTPAPPFSFVGVDVFGHWEIMTRRTRGGAASSKRWAVLFVCQSTRAIHLELIEEMSSSSFINALRRFLAIRGKVQEFRSDRGTNFVGATDDMNIAAINVEDNQVQRLLYDSGSVWRFNPPHASHMGGSWERLIGITRRVLDSVLMDSRNAKLTHEILCTLMTEVMAIVNSRPLVPVSSDIDDPFILTPAVLLTQKTDRVAESFDHIDIKDAYRSQWKRVQYLAELFWKRWRREYIHTLQYRQKWTTEKRPLQEGDVVIMKDRSIARYMWPLGRVVRVFPSDDEFIRKIEIRVFSNGKQTNCIRPITEVVKLL